MPTIFIDNKPYEVKEGLNLLHATINKGIDLPYFCWHPALGSVGACRQCAVQHYKDENDTVGRTVMACMTPVGKEMRFGVNHPVAVDFRARVIEWMMTNHPHDCPVCDEGGECHLQDMTVMTKHNYRRFRFKKRTFKNQYLGPFLNHEMNRCITCYRCVRYYQGVAGGTDLSAFSLSNRVYFGRTEDGTLENEFSGNLAEICPTGVFTDKPFKETYTRKWDLQTAPSVCQLCSVGCNILPGERYGTIRRVQNRYNPFVNGYFLCDRGRFGHSFVNSPERIVAPSAPCEPFKEGAKVIGIGSARASLETNFALRKSVGAQNFYLGLAKDELASCKKVLSILENGNAKSASLQDIEQSDAVFILGEDVLNTAPMVALAIRKSSYERAQQEAAKLGIASWHDQAVSTLAQGQSAPLMSASVSATKLDDIALATLHAPPDTLAHLGFAIANQIKNDAPKAPDLVEKAREFASTVAQFLSHTKKPVIIAGSGLQTPALIEAAANIAWALVANNIDARLYYALPEANSLGLSMLGDQSLDDAVTRIDSERLDAVIVLESDISKRLSEQKFDQVFERVPRVIAIDYLRHKTTERAIALPALPFSEITGTLINNEGRAQRFYSVFVPRHEIHETWRTIGSLFGKSWHNVDALSDDLCAEVPALTIWKDHVAKASFRMLEQKIPRQTQEWSGRTANTANISVNEPAPPKDPNSPLCHSMEGFSGHPPAELTPFFWAPGWNSVQALNKYLSDVDGDYKNDHVGCRLFEGKVSENPRFFAPTPIAEAKAGELRIIPRHYIFGSEERASFSEALALRIPKGAISIGEEDAHRHKLTHGSVVNVHIAEKTIILEVTIDRTLMPGFVLMPVGIKGLSLWLPKTCTISLLEAQA